jgi:hypothetical protein
MHRARTVDVPPRERERDLRLHLSLRAQPLSSVASSNLSMFLATAKI